MPSLGHHPNHITEKLMEPNPAFYRRPDIRKDLQYQIFNLFSRSLITTSSPSKNICRKRIFPIRQVQDKNILYPTGMYPLYNIVNQIPMRIKNNNTIP